MRAGWLAFALVAAACGKHDEPAKSKPPPAPVMDWTRCEKQIATLAGIHGDTERVQALIAACPVCGDWTPVIDWAKPRSEGGPSVQAIADRMTACDAWCNTKAKDFFLASLDTARGTNQRSPWRYLADECKDKVSAVPDCRYESAPYFALDRIGRAVAAHGGTAADDLGRFYIALPPISMTGSAIDVPEVAIDGDEIADNEPILTVLGDQLYESHRERAHLTASGVQLVAREGYPGQAVTAATFHADGPSVAVIAARGMRAKQLLALLPPMRVVNLAVRARAKLSGWPMIETVQVDTSTPIDDKMTVQDLAATVKPSIKIQLTP
jgi:hypothetical protein